MEACRFETSETLAAFVASTPLLLESWKLCNTANVTEAIQTHNDGRIVYVALPAMKTLPSTKLVALDATGDRYFSAFCCVSAANVPQPMVDAALLDLFSSIFPHVQSLIREGMEGRKRIVITGHSIGGSMASLTALWLLSHLQDLSSSKFEVLCITFGSPLLGNQSLSNAISRSRFDRNFCHVASTRDIIPGFLLSPLSPESSRTIPTSPSQFGGQRQNVITSEDVARRSEFWPFGSYLFCSNEGAICLDDAASVSKMLRMLNTRAPSSSIEDHLKYKDYVEILSSQSPKSRDFKHEVSESCYKTGVALAVESLGIHHEEPEAAAAAARECIEMARKSGDAPNLKAAELSRGLADVLYHRLRIQWYKERCDALEEQLGFYDFFKRRAFKRDHKINTSRVKLAKFWDGVVEMIEANELPLDFHLRKKWIYASNFYQLLVEPLDIAEFYRNRKPGERGRHYLTQGNRPKRYEEFDKWWKNRSKTDRTECERTRNASSTQDACFWAKLEEAKEYLEDIESENDMNKRSMLWGKIVEFESYANELEKKKEVSIDVLAKNSSYSVWKETLGEFKMKYAVSFSEVGEDVAMETNEARD